MTITVSRPKGSEFATRAAELSQKATFEKYKPFLDAGLARIERREDGSVWYILETVTEHYVRFELRGAQKVPIGPPELHPTRSETRLDSREDEETRRHGIEMWYDAYIASPAAEPVAEPAEPEPAPVAPVAAGARVAEPDESYGLGPRQ